MNPASEGPTTVTEFTAVTCPPAETGRKADAAQTDRRAPRLPHADSRRKGQRRPQYLRRRSACQTSGGGLVTVTLFSPTSPLLYGIRSGPAGRFAGAPLPAVRSPRCGRCESPSNERSLPPIPNCRYTQDQQQTRDRCTPALVTYHRECADAPARQPYPGLPTCLPNESAASICPLHAGHRSMPSHPSDSRRRACRRHRCIGPCDRAAADNRAGCTAMQTG